MGICRTRIFLGAVLLRKTYPFLKRKLGHSPRPVSHEPFCPCWGRTAVRSLPVPFPRAPGVEGTGAALGLCLTAHAGRVDAGDRDQGQHGVLRDLPQPPVVKGTKEICFKHSFLSSLNLLALTTLLLVVACVWGSTLLPAHVCLSLEASVVSLLLNCILCGL